MIEPRLELSRPIEVGRIPPAGSGETIIAEPSERALIAERLRLAAVHSLTAELSLTRWRGEGVKVTGKFLAEVEQICAAAHRPSVRVAVTAAGTAGAPEPRRGRRSPRSRG